jgi:excisionase family DNA binding protein
MRRYTYTTQEVADLLKVHKKTILYWLKIGKITEPIRGSNNHRLWTKEDVSQLLRFKNESNEKRGRRKNGKDNGRKS